MVQPEGEPRQHYYNICAVKHQATLFNIPEKTRDTWAQVKEMDQITVSAMEGNLCGWVVHCYCFYFSAGD